MATDERAFLVDGRFRFRKRRGTSTGTGNCFGGGACSRPMDGADRFFLVIVLLILLFTLVGIAVSFI